MVTILGQSLLLQYVLAKTPTHIYIHGIVTGKMVEARQVNLLPINAIEEEEEGIYRALSVTQRALQLKKNITHTKDVIYTSVKQSAIRPSNSHQQNSQSCAHQSASYPPI